MSIIQVSTRKTQHLWRTGAVGLRRCRDKYVALSVDNLAARNGVEKGTGSTASSRLTSSKKYSLCVCQKSNPYTAALI